MENNQAAKKAFARYAERQGRPPKNPNELNEHIAVVTTIAHLESEGKSRCVEAVRFVYFYDPKNIHHKGEVDRRVARYSVRCNVPTRTTYRWLATACQLYEASMTALTKLVEND